MFLYPAFACLKVVGVIVFKGVIEVKTISRTKEKFIIKS